MADALNVCVAGVGAVGSLIAARLADGGIPVSLLARGARLQQLRTTGSDRAEFGVQDLICLAVKAQALPALLPTLAPLIGPHTRILPLVNGIPWWYFQGTHGAFAGDAITAVDPAGRLRDAFPAARLIGSVVYVTARLRADGIVTAAGTQRLAIGDLDTPARPTAVATTAVDTPAHPTAITTTASNTAITKAAITTAAVAAPAITTAAVHALFAASGLATSLSTDIRAELWTKVALNLATNPLSVVTEATLVEQFTDPLLIPLVTTVLEETGRLAAALGVAPARPLADLLATGLAAGPFQTSMLQDYLAGRELEIDAIGHAVLELAAKIGMEMPTTRLMIGLCTHRAARRA